MTQICCCGSAADQAGSTRNCPLLDARRLQLAGKLLSKYSDRLMSLAADALSAMKDLQNVKTGQMFIGASQTTGVYILPRLIREHPPLRGLGRRCLSLRCCYDGLLG